MTKAYSPHDFRSVWISNKSKFNTTKNGSIYPVLTWSEFRPDMHQAFMVNGQYQIWITLGYSCVRYHKNTQQLWQNRHKYPILAQSQSICYVHKAAMMVDHCTQHEQNPLIHLQYITIYKIYKIIDLNATFWHRAMVYFMCIKSLLWLITVPNMNKINTFFSEISQQKHKISEKYCYNYSNFNSIQQNAILYASATHGTW